MEKKRMAKTLCFLLVIQGTGQAQMLTKQDSLDLNLTGIQSKWEYGAGYFVPSASNSHINTFNLDVYFWKKYFRHSTVLVNIGAVSSYASGYVDQLRARGTELVYDRHTCSAAGLGPSLQIQLPFVQVDRFSMEAEANGSFLVYNQRFPYGGYIYNFMFRAGPNFCWTLRQNFVMKMGYRWMHVSNGSGPGPQNPWYNAQGLTLSLVKYLH